jgi:hypothetical protein
VIQSLISVAVAVILIALIATFIFWLWLREHSSVGQKPLKNIGESHPAVLWVKRELPARTTQSSKSRTIDRGLERRLLCAGRLHDTHRILCKLGRGGDYPAIQAEGAEGVLMDAEDIRELIGRMLGRGHGETNYLLGRLCAVMERHSGDVFWEELKEVLDHVDQVWVSGGQKQALASKEAKPGLPNESCG